MEAISKTSMYLLKRQILYHRFLFTKGIPSSPCSSHFGAGFRNFSFCSKVKRRPSDFLSTKNNHRLIISSSLSFFSRSATVDSNITQNIVDASKSLPFEIGPIPEPPPIPSSETFEELQRIIADNMREIGIASYGNPAGWVQNLLDILHSTTGLPWWQVIVMSTILIRLCTLPVMISSQRKSSLMSLHQNEISKRQAKVRDAYASGDSYERNLAMMDVQQYMKDHKLPTPGKMFLPSLANALVFMSYFFALRGMAKHSLWSLQHEGFLWWPDLTLTDPTFILPGICAVTMMVVMELGIEFGTAASSLQPTVRWLIRLMPISILFFGKMMPVAVLCYWITSNSLSLIISLVFRIPSVRKALKFSPLPPTRSWSQVLAIPDWTKTVVTEPRVFWRGIKDWRKNRKARPLNAAQIRQTDTKRFKAAGEGPMPPTFTFNPKTKYKEMYEEKGFLRKLKDALSGDESTKKTNIRKRVTS